MRTTVHLDDHLLIKAKQQAARQGKTLTSLIAEGLQLILGRSKVSQRKRSISLPTFKGDGLQPGVDLDCNASLLDLMSESK